MEELIGTHGQAMLLSDAMYITIPLTPKPQKSDRGSSTICVAIERPDHNCGDGLVFLYCTEAIVWALGLISPKIPII